MMVEGKVPSRGTESDYVKTIIAVLGCYDGAKIPIGRQAVEMLMDDFQHMSRGETGHR